MKAVEAGVQGVENRPAHGHAVMAFEHRRGVGEHGRNRIAALQAETRERRAELAGAGVEIPIIAAQRAMDDRQTIREHSGRALQQRQRRQRLIIGGVAIEIAIVNGVAHRGLRSFAQL